MRDWFLDAHAYQETTVEHLVRQPRCGLFADPGLGKTAMALEAFRRLRDAGRARRLLVVAPLRPCYSVWPAEAGAWADFAGLRVHVLHGKGRTEAALRAGADVYVLNPETLPWLVGGKVGEKREYPGHWRGWRDRPDVLVVDESTKFKRYTANRSRFLQKLLPDIERRYPMTGTPAPNGLMDLHGQVRIIDDGAALGRTLEEFRCEFFVPIRTDYGWDWRPRKDAAERIYKLLGPLVVRLDAQDHLDLPELVKVERRVPMPSRVRGLYDRLRREMVVALERGDVVATNAGALTSKCRQLASGVVYLNDAEEIQAGPSKRWDLVHTAKVDALVELVEELGGKPLLVATEFRHEVTVIQNALRTRLKVDAPYVGSGMSAKRGKAALDAWNEGRLRVLLVNSQAAAHGLNLQAGGHHLCWYTPTWDLELYLQLVARLWRQGQESSRVFLHHLVMERTVDERVVRVCGRKNATQDDLLEALKRDLGVTTRPERATTPERGEA